MKEKEEQRYGRNKDTVVDKGYLNGGEFRKKFDKLSDSPKLNRLLYRLAKKMLLHRSGTKFEDMYWIDPTECKIVTEEINGQKEKRITYTSHTKDIISKHAGLVTIHTHPEGLPPSVKDLNSNHTNDYSFGIVVTHDGKVFIYKTNRLISDAYYTMKVVSYKLEGYNEFEAQMKTLQYCREHFGVFFEEVIGDD